MEELDTIIKVGGVITAAIVIWRAIVFFVHFADDIKQIKQYVADNSGMAEDIKDIKRHMRENYLSCLRLTVMSHDMPIGERIIAGNDYIEAGGNGEVKKYIENELHTKEIKHD